MNHPVKGLLKLLAITLGLVLQSTFLIQYSVEARRLRNVTVMRISKDICMYAEAVPDTSVADFAHWIVRHTRNRGGDADDIYAVLALLKRRCPLDLTQNSIYYLSNEESVQAIIKDMRVSSGIRRLCEEAKNTSIDEAQEFSDSVLDAINSLRIANAYIPDFYDALKENCEEVKPLLAKASEERRKEANERLKEYGYQEGMTYSQFREVLINRGWQPVTLKEGKLSLVGDSSSSYPDYGEVGCGSLLCTGSFISNENKLFVTVRFVRNDESREVEKIIPTDLSVSTKNRSREIDINSKYADAYYDRGEARREQGDLALAIEEYTRAIDINPEDAAAYYDRGKARYQQGNLALAIEDYDRAININPEYAGAYNNRGLAHYQQGNLALAIEDYNRAIKINPEYAGAYNNRGLAHYQQGNLALAIEEYTRAIEINPDFALAYYNRGLARDQQGDLALAIEDYTGAIEINPDFALAYHRRGNDRREQGDLALAIEDVQTAATIYQKRGDIPRYQYAMDLIEIIRSPQ